MEAIRQYITQGGVFIYPILAFSVWGVTLLIERFMFYRRVAFRTTHLQQEFFRRLDKEGAAAAREYLAGETGILRDVLDTALANETEPLATVERRVNEAVLARLPMLSKFLNTIATLGGLMPFLGLLGTVTGMIATFRVIALQGTGDAQAMADGISEALITTQAGLVAAVPLILGHNFLNNRLSKVIAVLKASATRVIDYIETNRKDG